MRFIIQPFEHGHPKAYEPEGLGGKMTVALYDKIEEFGIRESLES